MTDKFNDIFEIDRESVPVIEVTGTDGKSTVIPPEAPGVEEDIDFQFVRANHYQLAAQAQEAMMIAMRVARESEQPRAIETLSTLLKTASEVNRQLLLLSKDKAETKTAKTNKNQQQTNIGTQNVVVASSSELNKLLRGDTQNNNTHTNLYSESNPKQ
jgi:hypothetical protein